MQIRHLSQAPLVPLLVNLLPPFLLANALARSMEFLGLLKGLSWL